MNEVRILLGDPTADAPLMDITEPLPLSEARIGEIAVEIKSRLRGLALQIPARRDATAAQVPQPSEPPPDIHLVTEGNETKPKKR